MGNIEQASCQVAATKTKVGENFHSIAGAVGSDQHYQFLAFFG
jgi:hypothetical protein